MLDTLKKSFQLLCFNAKGILIFEFFYKILGLFVVLPIFSLFFRFAMKLTGFSYLTFENYTSFLLNPLTIFLIIIFLAFLTFYFLFEAVTLVIFLDQSHQEKRPIFFETLKLSVLRAKRVFSPHNLALLLVSLLLLVFLGLSFVIIFVFFIKVPEYILDFIFNTPSLLILLTIIVAALVYLALRWIYSIFFFTLERPNLKKSLKQSSILVKKTKIRTITLVIAGYLIYFAAIFAAIGILYLISRLFGMIFSGIPFVSSLNYSIMLFSSTILLLLFSIFYTPINYSIISASFYEQKILKDQEIKHLSCPVRLKKTNIKLYNRIFLILSIITIVFGTFFIKNTINGSYNFDIEYIHNVEVTAHRGASGFYPENTMAAFRSAKELGADWIELDVQQSRDGKIFVSHDSNFSRITGVNKNAWELDYSEISKLDAGNGEKMPLLSEVLEFSKWHDIRLNIELKPTGHEIDFEKKVVDLVDKYNIMAQCVFASENYETIVKLKTYNNNLTTVYVMPLAYGDIDKLDAADIFSIESESISKNLIETLHNHGKKVYAWTINTEKNIRKMIKYDIDNIITDDIPLAQRVISDSKTSNIAKEYLNTLSRIFE